MFLYYAHLFFLFLIKLYFGTMFVINIYVTYNYQYNNVNEFLFSKNILEKNVIKFI